MTLVKRTIAIIGLYLGVAIAQTAPLAANITSHIPYGTYPAATTARFSLWTLWWNSDRLSHGYMGYWKAPIFQPDDSSFAYSEPQLLTGLFFGSVYGVVGNPAVAYNVVVLAIFTLNGLCSFHLMRRLRVRFWPAVLGGLFVELLPIAADQIGVLQSTVLFPIPMVLASLIQFARSKQMRSILSASVWMAVYFHTSSHLAFLFGPIALLGLALLAARALLSWRSLLSVVAATAVTVSLVAPMVIQQFPILNRMRAHRPERMIRSSSADVNDFFKMPATNWLRQRRLDHRGFAVSPGIALLPLGLAGLWHTLRRKQLRLWGIFNVLALALSVLLSFGPTLSSPLVVPYQLLADYYPGFGVARNLWRFAGIAQVLLAVLATLGVAEISGRMLKRRWLAESLCALLVIADLFSAPIGLLQLEQPTRLSWIEWLRNAPLQTPFVHVPMARGGKPEDYDRTTYWMVCQIYHGKPMANGYSGYVPSHTSELAEAMRTFPDKRSFTALRYLGISVVLIEPEWMDRHGAEIKRWTSTLISQEETPEMGMFRIVD